MSSARLAPVAWKNLFAKVKCLLLIPEACSHVAMLTYTTGPALSLRQGAFELGSGSEPLVCGLIWTAFPSHLIQ